MRIAVRTYAGLEEILQSEIESIKRLTDKKSKVSSHYLINRKGEVIQMVKDRNIAWHAGKSKWKKFSRK